MPTLRLALERGWVRSLNLQPSVPGVSPLPSTSGVRAAFPPGVGKIPKDRGRSFLVRRKERIQTCVIEIRNEDRGKIKKKPDMPASLWQTSLEALKSRFWQAMFLYLHTLFHKPRKLPCNSPFIWPRWSHINHTL